MAQQVLYATANGQIIQWQDTEAFNYGVALGGTAVLLVTADEWAAQSAPQYVANPGTANAALATGTPPIPLEEAQATQIALLAAEYQTAIVQNVSYTSKGGVTKTYQADAASVANLTSMLLGFQVAAATPAGFYWLSVDNIQVPFTYADMQGLAAAFAAQGAAAFFVLQTKKAAVLAATSVAAAQAIS